MDEAPPQTAFNRALFVVALLVSVPQTLVLAGSALGLTFFGTLALAAKDGRHYYPFLFGGACLLAAYLYNYWRLVWLAATNRLAGPWLQFSAVLLCLLACGWGCWAFLGAGVGGGFLLLAWAGPPFVCWVYVFFRTY